MRLSTLTIATLATMLVVMGSGAQAFGAGNTTGPPPPDGTVSVTLPNTYTDNAFYSLSLGALPDSVSINIYAVTGPATVAITVTDCCAIADYYQLWESSNPGFTAPALVGTTPQVETDSSLVAPTYNSLWDGNGHTLSSATFIVSVPSGTTYFAVRDALQDAMGTLLDAPCGGIPTSQLVTLGCNVPGISVFPEFLLAGFSITFTTSTSQGAPEFSSPPLVVAALALPLLFLLRRMTPVGRRSYD